MLLFSKEFFDDSLDTAGRKDIRDYVAAPLSIGSIACSSISPGVVFCGGRDILCDPGDSAQIAVQGP